MLIVVTVAILAQGLMDKLLPILYNLRGILNEASHSLQGADLKLDDLLGLLHRAQKLLTDTNECALKVHTEFLEHLATNVEEYLNSLERAVRKLVVASLLVERLIKPKPGGTTVCTPEIVGKELGKVLKCIELNIKLLENTLKPMKTTSVIPPST